MSISDNYSPDISLGNGVTTVFTGTWKVLNEDYFRCALQNVATGVQSLLVNGTDYALSFNESGYTVTLSTAPSSAYEVVRYREISLDQTVPYRTSKGFQGGNTEASFDKLTAIAQDIKDGLDRALVRDVNADFIDVGGYKLADIGDPEDNTDAVNKSYVDSVMAVSGNVPSPVSADAGKILHATGASAFSWGIGPYVSVTDYGADPTGATDSSDAFEDARDAATANGAYAVFIPAGTYKIDEVHAGAVFWFGAGVGLSIIKRLNNNDAFSGGSQYVSFSSIEFDGEKATQDDRFAIAINANDVTIQNCYFHNWPLSPFIQGNTAGSRWKIIGNRIYNCGLGVALSKAYVGLPIVSGADCRVADNVVICDDGLMGAGIGIETNTGNTDPVLRCHIYGNTVVGAGIVVDGGNKASSVSEVIISNNLIDARGYASAVAGFDSGAPIYMRDSANVKVTGNRIWGHTNGLYQILTTKGVTSLNWTDNDVHISPPSSGTSYGYYAAAGALTTKSTGVHIAGDRIVNVTGNSPTEPLYMPDAYAAAVSYEGVSTYGNFNSQSKFTVPNNTDPRVSHVRNMYEYTRRQNVTFGGIAAGATASVLLASGSVAGSVGDMINVACLTTISDSLKIEARFSASNQPVVLVTNTSGSSITPGVLDLRLVVSRFSLLASSVTNM